MLKGIGVFFPPLDAALLNKSMRSLSEADYRWDSGYRLEDWLPPGAPLKPFILYVCSNSRCYQSSKAYITSQHGDQWYYYKNCSDEVTMSAFNFMGQDLERTANFLWEQGYTQQLIDKLTNGATVEELLLRGDSYD